MTDSVLLCIFSIEVCLSCISSLLGIILLIKIMKNGDIM